MARRAGQLGSAARVAAKSPRSSGKPGERGHHPLDRLGGELLGLQLGAHAIQPDLIQLIQCDEDAAVVFGRKATRLGQPIENLAVVDAHGEAGEAERGDGVGGGAHQLDLGQLRRLAHDIDIALDELAITPRLRTFGAPDRANLNHFEGRRELRDVVGVVARQRRRQIVAQAQINQVIFAHARAAVRSSFSPRLSTL